MNRYLLIVLTLGICLTGCSEKETTVLAASSDPIAVLEVPDRVIDKSELFYDRQTSVWTLDGQLYSGHAASYYPDGTLKEKFGILKGRKQNQAIHWYTDGHYQFVANYHQGKLSGDKKTWSRDSSHTLLAHLRYVSGKLHGEQKKWYVTGELFKKLNLNMGKEEGLQQAYRKNGALFANYEAREGRIFGLKKTALCYGLEDENIRTTAD